MTRPGQKTAMISSTARDLPEHRHEVIEACLREGVFPIGMEHLPARDADAIRVSLEMVDKADIYIGIFAWRYGHKPEGHDISITEMEFNRAVERKIPILVFLIHKDHPLTIKMVETDKDAQKRLAELKERAGKRRGRREFKSPEDLRGEVIHALSDLQKREQESSGEKVAPDFHPPNTIPKPPDPYIAHPYSLLQTKDVVGRQAELNLLTDWVTTNKQVPADTRIFNLVAIGGMGKSALTWKWFNDIAPNELPKLAGRMWWSFYESDAHWDNFIIRALAYVSGLSEKGVREMKSPDREHQLCQILDRQPFLLVLDGLERILLAYARMDAAQMLDDELDEKTANRGAKAIGFPASAADSFIGKQRLRLTADHRTGQFLRRLARITNSRFLITTRLYPIDLQAETGDPLPGCAAQFLTGLVDSDSLNLWREFKVTGSAEQLLPLFRSFGNYPLLIRALAGEVARYRPAPRDFDKWRTDNPKFDPTRLLLKDAKTHVLEYALRGLPDEHRKVLHTIAAFRMPATWDTLRALLVESGPSLQATATPESEGNVKRRETFAHKVCATDHALDLILTELEDRGLVGWDKESNRYDLHPIVRSVVWAALAPDARRGIYSELHGYFDAAPRPPEWQFVSCVEDLTPALELFHALVGLERYDDAYAIFWSHIRKAIGYKLGAFRRLAEFLEYLFPDGLNKTPRLSGISKQSDVFNDLAVAYHHSGEPRWAAEFYYRSNELSRKMGNPEGSAIRWGNLAEALLFTGSIRNAEDSARHELRISRRERDIREEGISLYYIGFALSIRNDQANASIAFKRALATLDNRKDAKFDAEVRSYFAQHLLRLNLAAEAMVSITRTWHQAHVTHHERDFIRAARLHGEAALGLGDLARAEEHLNSAVTRARSVNLAEEELPALAALAELHRQRKQYRTARELLEQIWDLAERGPYPLFHADALNVLAQIERDEGNTKAAITAATKAYTLAWCDGPPYAYHYGLTSARKHLQELGAPEPQLPPFDESKFEPMPDVELNPKDKFWVDPDKLD